MAGGRPVTSGMKVDRRDDSVGNILRRARFDLKLGLKEVSERSGTSLQFLSNIENGRAPMPFDLVKDLSAVLRLNPNYIASLILIQSPMYQKYLDVSATY